MSARSPRNSVAASMSTAATTAAMTIGTSSARAGRPVLSAPRSAGPPIRASRQTMTMTATTTTARTTPTRSVITRLAGLPMQAGESL